MPYQLSWLVEGRIISGKFSGKIPKELIPVFDREMLSYLDAGTAPLVHCISDITDLESAPSLTAMIQFTYVKHPRMGWQILCGGKPALKLLGNLASQVFRIRFRSFGSLEEALAFLQQVDSTLPVEITKTAEAG